MTSLELNPEWESLGSVGMSAGDDDDIYGDLFVAAPVHYSREAICSQGNNQPQATGTVAEAFLEHDLKELRSELESCKVLLEGSQQQLIASQQQCTDLEGERSTLVRNISVLFRTATLELERKADEIKSLRKEVHELKRATSSSQQVENRRASPGLPMNGSTTSKDSDSRPFADDRKREREAGGHPRPPLGTSHHSNRETRTAQLEDVDRGKEGPGSKRRCVEEPLGTRDRSRPHDHYSHDRAKGGSRRGYS